MSFLCYPSAPHQIAGVFLKGVCAHVWHLSFSGGHPNYTDFGCLALVANRTCIHGFNGVVANKKKHFLTGFSLRLHVAGAGGKAHLLKERSPQSSPEKTICILQNLLPEGLSFNKLASKY